MSPRPSPQLLEALSEWIRIPSVSTDGGDPASLGRAASWIGERIRRAGGRAELLSPGGANPLVLGDLRGPAGAPTVLLYGHYDVQGAGPADEWTSPPFEAAVRGGRLYARGASDDKGNLLAFLEGACALAVRGELPVNLRVLVEGEEEIGSEAALAWIGSDDRGADAAIVLDSEMADPRTPALTVGLRGLVQLRVQVRVAEGPVHSGSFGGTVLNAAHVLARMLAAVLPAPDGSLREELWAGVKAPSTAELEAMRALPPRGGLIATAGSSPLGPEAERDFHLRTGAQPSLDVNHLAAGQPRSAIPASATATLGLRLAQGQDPGQLRVVLERLLAAAAPAAAQVSFEAMECAPVLIDPAQPALRLAATALGSACGTPARFLRIGGSIPIVSAMLERSIPPIVTGFALPEDGAHAPDESIALSGLALGERSAPRLLRELATLSVG